MSSSSGELVFFTVGVILKPQGLKGEVRVKSLMHDIEQIADVDACRIHHADGREERLVIRSIRMHGQKVLFQFDGVDDRISAENLAGAEIRVRRELMPQLDEDEYYLGELIGYRVVTDKGAAIGEVGDIMDFPANDVIQVSYEGREVLIPMIPQVINSVDHESRQITITLMEGLLD